MTSDFQRTGYII